MGMDRYTKQLHHQKSQKVTTGTGEPAVDSGGNGSISIRDVNGQIVLFAKYNGDWYSRDLGHNTRMGEKHLTHLSIDDSGIHAMDGFVSLAHFGQTLRIGEDSSSKSALRVASDGSITIGTSGTTAVTISSSGAGTFAGALTATSGAIGGWTIGSAKISTGSGSSYYALDQGNSKIQIGAKDSRDDGNTGVHLGTDGLGIGANGVFVVTAAGEITATSATITGAITCGSGSSFSGRTWNGSGIDTDQLAADAITTAKIADDAVTTATLAADAVTAAIIADDAVNTAQLADDAVTAAVLADDAVGTAAIANDAVTNALIATDAVNQDSIAANSVTASEIVAGTITATEIAGATITAAKIAGGTITASQIAGSTITASEIAGTTITAAKIATGTITASQISGGTITANEIAGTTITAAKIATGTITASQINTASITSAVVTADSVNAVSINADSINAGTLAAARVSSDLLQGTTVIIGEVISQLTSDGNLAIKNVSLSGKIDCSDGTPNVNIGSNQSGLGVRNTFLGDYSGQDIQNGGTYNIGIGYKAGGDITTGDDNICIGKEAGDNIQTGNNNVIIGGVDADATNSASTLKIASGNGGVTWITGTSGGAVTISGGVTTNITGNASGSSGSCTGNAATATTLTGTINNSVGFQTINQQTATTPLDQTTLGSDDNRNNHVRIGSFCIAAGSNVQNSDSSTTIAYGITFTKVWSLTCTRIDEGHTSPMNADQINTDGFTVDRNNGIDGKRAINWIAVGTV